jgi:hypothetical protein
VAFKLKFEPVSPEADTKNKIIGMKQGKRTFGELVADFETWASQTGLTWRLGSTRHKGAAEGS